MLEEVAAVRNDDVFYVFGEILLLWYNICRILGAFILLQIIYPLIRLILRQKKVEMIILST